MVVFQVAAVPQGAGDMKCPKCQTQTLVEKTIKKFQHPLEQCSDCKGLFFDQGELAALLGKRAAKNFSIPSSALKQNTCLCPKCSQSLFEFCYPGTMTLIDACKSCTGVWLDNQEWYEINVARDVANKIDCPKCHTSQTKADACTICGIIFEKYFIAQNHAAKAKKEMKTEEQNEYKRESYADDVPGIKGSLLRFIDGAIDTLTDY